ncbi:carboxylesterase family protein [bacterium]|nr:carboxylesterase family protein [bacterium]
MKKLILLAVPLLLLILIYIGYQKLKMPTLSVRKNLPTVPDTIRPTLYGKVIGSSEQNGSHVWLGIPYAKPPVNQLRWRPPQPPEPWDNVRKAVSTESICTQIGGLLGGVPQDQFDKPIGSEDCLYLNIWAPPFSPDNLPTGDKQLPVMVWIHGGGNSIGHGGNYVGKDLAINHKVILVTINYRLGPFGWFYHPAIREQGEQEIDKTGNFGNLDTIRALTWVKNNISGFGGNPDNVTVFGESAGGRNTLTLMQSPLAKGLFHKAIVQSGAFETISPAVAENYQDAPDPGSPHSSREIINRLLISDKLAENREQAKAYQNNMSLLNLRKYLYNKSNFDLIKTYKIWAGGMLHIPRMVKDDIVFPSLESHEIFKDTGNYTPIPLLIGTNRDEFKIFMAEDTRFVDIYFGLYRKIKNTKLYNLYAKYRSDAWKATGADNIARQIAQSDGGNVYVYRFDWDEEPSILGIDVSEFLGAAHGVEIPFVFGNSESGFTSSFTDSEENRQGRMQLSSKITSYWTQFAYSGAPEKGRDNNQVYWAPWNGANTGRMMILDSEKAGGTRMVEFQISLHDIKKRLIEETEIENREIHCSLYLDLFFKTPFWNETEYMKLNDVGCKMPLAINPIL